MKILLSLFLLCATCAAQTMSGVSSTGMTAGGAVMTVPQNAGATPSMGWNSWLYGWENSGGAVISEALVKMQADALVSTGLQAKGYTLVSIDAGWQQCVSGSPPCAFEAIPSLFPDGMAATAAYVHADGELIGLYGGPGTLDCVNAPGQYQYEATDAASMASWGIDYFKSDWCSAYNQYGTTPAGVEVGYAKIVNAVNGSGRKINVLVNAYYSLSPYTSYNSLLWYQQIGAQSLRIGGDNSNTSWATKATSLNWTSYQPYQGRGFWLDPDCLMFQLNENQNGGPSGGTPVTDTEARAQFNFYSVVAAPLIIGTYVTVLDSTNLATLGNSGVIAIDQDSIGKMGTLAATTTCGSTVCQVWGRTLALTNPDCTGATTGCMAVALINYDPSSGHSITANWSALGITGTWNICDLWASIGTCTSEGSSSSSYTYSGGPAWGSTMLILTQ